MITKLKTLFSVLVFFSTSPTLAVALGGPFELDANTFLNSPPKEDWEDAFSGNSPLSYVFVKDDASPDYSVHQPSNKDIKPLSSMGCIVKSNVTNKLDLRATYAATYLNSDNEEELYFGSNRASNNGSAMVGFWFFQDQVSCDPKVGTFVGKKRHGDIFLAADFGGNSGKIINLYVWADPTPNAPESGDEFLGNGVVAGTPLVEGIYCNSGGAADLVCALTNLDSPVTASWESSPIPERAFLEGGMNLTKYLKQLGIDTCFFSTMTESRSSFSLNADLEDFTLNDFNTCAQVSVSKTTIPSDSVQGFSFNFNKENSLYETFVLRDGQAAHEITGLRPGSYSITELATDGWNLTSVFCSGGPFGSGQLYTNGASFEVGLGESITCSYVNTKPDVPKTTLTIDKVTNPAGDPDVFTFLITNSNLGYTNTFGLTDDGGSRTFELAPGTYTVGETISSPWINTQIICTGGVYGAGTSVDNNANIQLRSEDHVACIFYNQKVIAPPKATITVDKVMLAPGDQNQQFGFTLHCVPPAKLVSQNLLQQFSLSANSDPYVVTDVDPGYCVIKEASAGFDVSARCEGGAFGAGADYVPGSYFAVNTGDNVKCTFTNKPLPYNFCKKKTVEQILVTRFPNNRGMDLLVRTDRNESIQSAVDSVSDLNGDGYVLVGVIANGNKGFGGTTKQRVSVDRSFNEPFGLIACSVTMAAPDLAEVPVGQITANATAPSIFVMDLHTSGSRAEGWKVDGKNRVLKNIRASLNQVGIAVLGENNELDSPEADGNSLAGIQLFGNRHLVTSARVHSNRGNGVEIVATNSALKNSTIGEQKKGNAGNGVVVVETGNLISNCKINSNAQTGIRIATQGSGKTSVEKNTIGARNVGNRNGIILSSGVAWFDENKLEYNLTSGVVVDSGAGLGSFRKNTSRFHPSCDYDLRGPVLDRGSNKATSGSVALVAGQCVL